MKKEKTERSKTLNDVSKGIENVAINDIPKPKSKNLDVIAEFEKTEQKPAANFVVIGGSTQHWKRPLRFIAV